MASSINFSFRTDNNYQTNCLTIEVMATDRKQRKCRITFHGSGTSQQKRLGLDLISTTPCTNSNAALVRPRTRFSIRFPLARHSMPRLKDEYSRVLKERTAHTFSDGKTSLDYRRERFTPLPAHFSLPQDDQLMTQLLECYETTLMANLELKGGALELLWAI